LKIDFLETLQELLVIITRSEDSGIFRWYHIDLSNFSSLYTSSIFDGEVYSVA
jgi:hypothetical protein